MDSEENQEDFVSVNPLENQGIISSSRMSKQIYFI